jgi:two-component system KDP operon response regulator KdpE
MSRVLVADDEAAIRKVVRDALTKAGHDVETAVDGEEAGSLLESASFDLVITDLNMPRLDGLELVRKIRTTSSVPILVLTVRQEEREKVRLLDAGADDYVTKPFGVNELLARIRAALRHASRTSESGESVFVLGDLEVDLGRRQVFVSEKEVHLTPIEYKLLTTLIRYAGKVLTHRQLLKEVWGPLHVNEGHYLRVYMRQLRNKLERNPAHPRYLVTELGVGYRLRTE